MLNEYVRKHCERGSCICGKCFDAPENPEKLQPNGHTVDLMFFKVRALEKPDKNKFMDMVKAEYPQWLDGKEHSYLEIGGDVGDQGLALMTMGLGKILEAWELLTPNSTMPFLPEELKQQMASQGMITIKA